MAVPALGFGTAALRGKKYKSALTYALELGYRHIDTAAFYGNEDAVGRVIAASGIDRRNIFLTTKIWPSDLAPEAFRQSLDQSLEHLQTDHVNLLLIHWPNRDIPLGETLGAFTQAKEAGRAQRIGVSNFPVALMNEVIETHGADLFANKVEYPPFLSQRSMLKFYHQHDVIMTVYCPLEMEQAAKDKTLTRIVKRYGKTPAQVTFRSLIDQHCVAASPKASGKRHVKQNFEIFDFTRAHSMWPR
jgi:2,5-diketo-D-gluconate reductase B